MNLTNIFSDIYWVFWREIKKFFQQRTRIIMIAVQPLVWLVLMGNAMTGLTNNPIVSKMLGTGSYLEFMTPGIMIMTALFGGVFGGTSVLWDRRTGFLNKLLAAPIHRAAIPMGKILAIGIQTMLQALIIVFISFAIGVRVITGIPGIICLLLISGLFGMIMGSISLSLASKIKSIEVLMAVTNFLTMPLMFTSNAIYPTSAMPYWLKIISSGNPLSYAVSVMRTIISKGWIWSEIWLPIIALILILIVSVSISIRMYLKVTS